MSKPLIHKIIKDVSGKDNQYLSLSRTTIIKIAEKYASEIIRESEQNETTQREEYRHERIQYEKTQLQRIEHEKEAIQRQRKELHREKAALRIKIHRAKIAFSKGVKAGYFLRSNELYEKAMFEMWKKHIAGPTEKKACFNDHARFADVENLEIVEPEVIIK
jgi:hypothetical protein